MGKAKLIQKLILLGMAVIMVSCNSTKIVSSWSAATLPPNAMQKVLVLGMMRDREARDDIEQTMTAELRAQGVNAVTATSIFGPKLFEGQSEEQITARLKDSGFSSVMIVCLVDKNTEQSYTPGYSYPTVRVGFSRYYRRYMYMYDYMYSPGYYTSSTKYVLQADIYTLDRDELIYSAQTKSYDPTSSQKLAESFSKAIVQELSDKRIIPLINTTRYYDPY